MDGTISNPNASGASIPFLQLNAQPRFTLNYKVK
jgi:hypothetical protein